ncbi:MAG: hypothetical protein GX228_08315 [Firmicutes bacterium]|nr:hypothetical protein [Bacillota bacterium]NLL88915.1 hypothetical protein [Bacillota bacterium]
MRVLILHQAEPKMSEWAKNLQGALQNQKCQVNLIDTNYGSAAPISTAPYDLVVVMTTFRGLWRPIIPIAVDELLKRCTRLEGRRGIAIVANRVSAGRALRFLMHLMEVQGMIVEDFATVRSAKELPQLAERFARLGRRD